MRKFAWYGRLSTKDKQDPTISFPSQRSECAEKAGELGREVRRGQTENTRQGYRNGGRAPYGYRLRHEPHPDPRRARAGDTKSRPQSRQTQIRCS